MNEEFKRIADSVGANTDTSGRWVNSTGFEKFADALVSECIAVVENTGKQCAFTTFDLGVVNCTIAKSVEAIKEKFQPK